MPTNKMVAFVFAIVMALAMANTCVAQNSDQDYVDAHNKARKAVGVGDVSWDTTVEEDAQNYANQRKADCALSHSENRRYGENIYTGKGMGYEDGINAVDYWVSEKQYYDYDSNSCSAGEYGCLHYTQVVWNTSTTIGCARVVCDNDAGVFIICNYYPPGNWQGEKPY